MSDVASALGAMFSDEVLPTIVGPVGACYGDDDPTERLLVFNHGKVMVRISLDRETAEIIDFSSGRTCRVPFDAERRRLLLEVRAEQVARIVEFFGLPGDFAA